MTAGGVEMWREKGVPEKYVRIVRHICRGKNEGQKQRSAHKHDHR